MNDYQIVRPGQVIYPEFNLHKIEVWIHFFLKKGFFENYIRAQSVKKSFIYC